MQNQIGLTNQMTRILSEALELVRFFKHEFIMPEHILMALLREDKFSKILKVEKMESQKAKVYEELMDWLSKQEKVPGRTKRFPEPSTLFKNMFNTACLLALSAASSKLTFPILFKRYLNYKTQKLLFCSKKSSVGDKMI